jgi:hypothetical protein
MIAAASGWIAGRRRLHHENNMPFTGATFDPETLALLQCVFDDVWAEAQVLNLPVDADLVRNLLAARLMLAAADGERDPAKLKAAALGKHMMRI